MPQIEPESDDAVIAAELALGLLEGADLAEARRRQIAEPAFARQVEIWREHFAALSLQSAERAPPEALAARVAEAVSRDRGGSVTPIKGRTASQQRSGLWRVAGWAGGGGIAAALAIALLCQSPAQAPFAAPVLVAALDLTASSQTVLASLDSAGQLHLAGQIAVPEAHDAQLWLIAGKAAPRSLGLLRRDAAQRLTVAGSAAVGIAAGTTLAISIEPLGGSPTGLPTGPVVASGLVKTI